MMLTIGAIPMVTKKNTMAVGVEKMLKVGWQMLLKVMKVTIGISINYKQIHLG